MALARKMSPVRSVRDLDIDSWHDAHTLHWFLHVLLFSTCASDKKRQSEKAQVSFSEK